MTNVVTNPVVVEHTETVFELTSGPSANGAVQMLGLWQALPQPIAKGDEVSFSVDEALQTGSAVWRADLPANTELASRYMAGAESNNHLAPAKLEEAANRLDTFVTSAAAQAGLSFEAYAHHDVSVVGEPEQDLWGLLREISNGEAPVNREAPVVSYGIPDALGGAAAQTIQQFQAFLDLVSQALAHYAWVETRAAGEVLGLTSVGWTGDVDVAWLLGLTSDQESLHQRNLALVLASRRTLLKTLALASQGAVTLAKISVLVSTPFGPVLALAAAWRFINRVLEEGGLGSRVS